MPIEKAIKPTVDRLKLAEKMNCQMILSPSEAARHAKLFELLARICDREEAIRHYDRQIRRSVVWISVWLLVIAAMAYFSA